MLFFMLAVWLGVTALAIGLAVYRGVYSLREEDQLFLDPGEEHLRREQREVIGRMEKLEPWLRSAIIASVVLGLATFGYWVYEALSKG